MGKKCQVDDNISSQYQVNHNLIPSVSYNKTSEHISRDVDFSTLSSERVYSANHSLIKSDVSSEFGHTLKQKRKNQSVGTPEEISQGDSTPVAPYPYKHLKADSSSSRNSGAVAQLSSVDSVDLKPTHSLIKLEHSHPSQSVESKKAFHEPEFSVKSSHCEFDLNEDVEGNRANSYPNSILESNYSTRSVLSEPIPVVAKVGIPMGYPEKPLQFDGERGWIRSRITSAFSPTSLKTRDIEKTAVSRGFDLNIAATPDPDFPVDEASVYVSPQVSERVQFHGPSGILNHHRPATLGIDLNHNPMIEEAPKSICRQGQTQQLIRNYDTIGSLVSPNISNCSSSPYWVDISSARGYGHVQGQPFLLGATTTQGQMMVPIQLANTPGFYFGNINNLAPTFYPSPLHNQPGPALFATYPGDTRLLENIHGLNPHTFATMRQTILSNGSISLAGNPYGEQVTFPASSMRR